MKNVQIFKNHSALSEQAAEMIYQLIKQKPDALLCLATGESPMLAYELLSKKLHEGGVSTDALTVIGLDEWVGISPQNTGSCAWFLHTYIIGPLKLKAAQFKLFDGLAENLETECQSMDDYIKAHGGIDLMVVGVGINGHIGFNEPGVNPQLYSHVTALAPVTQSVGQKYFQEKTRLTQGITLGLKHLAEARQVLVLASGLKKAAVLKKTMESPVNTAIPSTLIRSHSNAVVCIDREAASQLSFLSND